MFCEDKVPDNEQADEDAGLLELKELVEDKMAEEEKSENELRATFAKCAIQAQDLNATAGERAALLKKLDDLKKKQLVLVKQQANENYEKKKKEVTKQCDQFMSSLFGEINWNVCLQGWDDIFVHEKPETSSASTSASTSSKCKVKSTKTNDTKMKVESDSIYEQFMNKSMPKPFSVKPEDEKKIEQQANIRAIVKRHANRYRESGSICEKQYNAVVELAIKYFMNTDGNSIKTK